MTMPTIILGIALAWTVVLLAGGAFVLLRAPDLLGAVAAFDLLVAVVVTLLALLSYLHDVSYYLDAALAVALLSFVATLAAARSVHRKDPF